MLVSGSVPPTTPIVSISSPSGNSFAALRLSKDITTLCMQHSFLSWPTQQSCAVFFVEQNSLDKKKSSCWRRIVESLFLLFFFSSQHIFKWKFVIPPKSFFTRKKQDFRRFVHTKIIWNLNKIHQVSSLKPFFLQNLQAQKSSHFVIQKNPPRFGTFHSFHSDWNSHQPEWLEFFESFVTVRFLGVFIFV